MPRPDLADITIVLDRSGSMASVVGDTIGGFNRFLEDQKNAPGEAALTLVQFDNVYESVHDAVRIQEVPLLTTQTFVPRGSTALLDAIGRAVDETGRRLEARPEADRPAKVIVVIVTDGQENSSHEYSLARINEMISRQRDTYSWEFVFLGANQDAIATASSMGIMTANAMSFAHNSVGTSKAFAATSGNILRSRSGGVASYSTEQRDDQKKAGASH